MFERRGEPVATRVFRKIFILIVFSLLMGVGMPSQAEGPRQVLILDIPRLTLDDLREAPVFQRLFSKGSVGIMTSANQTMALSQVYLEFNSGLLLTIDETGGSSALVLDTAEDYRGIPAGAAFHTLSGNRANGAGAVYVGLPKLRRLNAPDVASQIGRFGELLTERGIRTAAIGNADTDILNRSGALLLIDEAGRLDQAALGRETVTPDPVSPYGIRTDIDSVFTYWKRFRTENGVIVLTLGDLERLERFRPNLTDIDAEVYRLRIVAGYDRLLEELLQEVNLKSTLLVVFSALPPRRDPLVENEPYRLTPICLAGPDFGAGLLRSGGTRRDGLFGAEDLPLTLLQFLAPQSRPILPGRLLRTVPGDWRQLAALGPRLITNYEVRWPLLSVYGYFSITLVLLTLIALLFLPQGSRWRRPLQYLNLLIVSAPLVFLVMAIFDPLEWPLIIGLIAAALLLLIGGAYIAGKRDPLAMLGIISGLTVLFITLDGFNNGRLELCSFLGYSAVAGARFYGIGNEYLGYLIGAYVVWVSLILPRITRYRAPLLWGMTLLLTLLFALPVWGANIGGTITVFFGLSITTLLWLERPVRLRQMAGLAGILVLLLGLVALWDLSSGGRNVSHFGQWVNLLRSEGFLPVLAMIARKWSLNLKLIAFTPWTYVLMGLVLLIPLAYKKRSGIIKEWLERYPLLGRSLLGLSATGLVGLMVNDSGIVTLAMIFTFGIVLLLEVLLEEKQAKE
jgi:hypothetical protein